MKWVYIESEKGLWTTGFYDYEGKWNTDRDFSDKEDAAKRVHWLNGHAILSTYIPDSDGD